MMDDYGWLYLNMILFVIIMTPICLLISLITNINMLSLYLILCTIGMLGILVYEIIDTIKHDSGGYDA